MARGDFILWEAQAGNIGDALISTVGVPHGPYVHVSIDMGNGLYVEEHGAGLGKAAYQWHRGHTSVDPRLLVPKADIEAGLAWVEGVYEEAVKNQSTHLYGWGDVFDEALKVFGHRFLSLPVINQLSHVHSKTAWDCSHFCTLYLIHAGAAGPLGKLAETPELVAPNDLGIAFHVMPKRLLTHT